ncbi:hypothetical protein NSQ90_07665 [Paenibacillus sp. FSL H7-0737]|uniref:hypothetical protein n=1 Tax=Paenibacillus sp. FSL H7-0737 TaxID=1536775 RepID=UPI000A5220B4
MQRSIIIIKHNAIRLKTFANTFDERMILWSDGLKLYNSDEVYVLQISEGELLFFDS